MAFVEVGDRCWQARYRQWDVSVGLVAGAESLLVVDTRGATRQGREVLADVEALRLGLPVRHVVHTHVHFDHTFGTAAFPPEAVVVGHESLAESLPRHWREIAATLRADPASAPEHGYTAADVADVLATRVRAPDVEVSTRHTVDLGDRSVHLAHLGRAHTDGDLAVHVPDAGVSFLGDLVEESGPPSFGADSWPLEWGATLAAHRRECGGVVVPGHGAPVGLGFVDEQVAAIERVAVVLRERHPDQAAAVWAELFGEGP